MTSEDFSAFALGYSRSGPFVGNYLMGVDFTQLELGREFTDETYSWTWFCAPPPEQDVPPSFSATDEIEFAETRAAMNAVVQSWSLRLAPTELVALAAPLLYDEFHWQVGALSFHADVLSTQPIKLRTEASFQAIAQILSEDKVERLKLADLQQMLRANGFTLRLVPSAGSLSYTTKGPFSAGSYPFAEINNSVTLRQRLGRLRRDLFWSGHCLALTKIDATPVNDLDPCDPWREFAAWSVR